jgi:hypothetical protein
MPRFQARAVSAQPCTSHSRPRCEQLAVRRAGSYPRPTRTELVAVGVWKVKLDRETGNSSRPQLVGIGIEHHGRQCVFVATRMGAGAIAIAELWKHLDEGRAQTTRLELREN